MSLKAQTKKIKLATVVLSSLLFLLVLSIISPHSAIADDSYEIFFEWPLPPIAGCDFQLHIGKLNAAAPTIYHQVDWYKNGVHQDNLSQVVRTLEEVTVSKDNFAAGDVLECIATQQPGQPVIRKSITIIRQLHFKDFPRYPPILNINAKVGEQLSFLVIAEDYDGEVVYDDPQLPPGATIDPVTRIFSWTPTTSDNEQWYSLHFRAKDDIGIWVDAQANIYLPLSNIAPYFIYLTQYSDKPVFHAFVGEQFRLSAVAEDPDSDPITYIDPALPPGAVLDPLTRIMSWTPSESDAGRSYSLEFRASDGKEVGNSSVTIYVLQHMPAVDLSGYLPPVGNQGSLGSCTSWASGYYYKSFQETKEHNWDPSLPEHQCSPSFIYNQLLRGSRQVMVGTDFKDNYHLLETQGCASLKDMPYSEDLTIMPNALQCEAGMPFRAENHSCSPITHVNQLRNHLASGDILTISISAGSLPSSTGRNGLSYEPRAGAIYGDAHAITIVGYDDNREYAYSDRIKRKGEFKLVNSWGSNWGDHGYSWITYDDVLFYGGEICTMSDRIGYQPKAIAEFHITHPRPIDLDVSLSALVSGVEQFKRKLIEVLYNTSIIVNADIDVSFDITDAVDSGLLPPTLERKWLLGVANLFPAKTGVIDVFKIKYRSNINDAFTEFVATDVPIAIPDNREPVFSVIPSNAPPVFGRLENPITFTVGEQKSFTVTATDSDNDTLRFVKTLLPAGVRFTVNNSTPGAIRATFSWTPTLGQINSYRVGFQVSDGKATTGTSIEIKVKARPNTAPVLSPIGAKSALTGTALTFNVSATDADGDPLTCGIQNKPSGALLSYNPIAKNWSFNWTPAQSGRYTPTFVITDGKGGQASEKVTITVTQSNRPPSLSDISSQKVEEGKSLKFDVYATDPDGDSLIYYASNLPSGASFSGQTFSWTPKIGQAGSYTVYLGAMDPKSAVSAMGVSITVTKAAQPTPSPTPSPSPSPSR